jgi:rhamnosyltransferase
VRFYIATVLYNPTKVDLTGLLRDASTLGLLAVVFDNSDDATSQQLVRDHLREQSQPAPLLLSKGRNIGLSAAYNAIVDVALADPDAEAVIFLDQDSGVPTTSLRNLLDTYARLSSRPDQKIGVLSGMAMRPDGGSYRVYRTSEAGAGMGVQPVRMTPSSFSLIPVRAFREVGRFYDDFFIDHIDVDFCYRCRSRGLVVAIDPTAPFPHEIGHGMVSVLGYPLTPISSPFRHYYQTRNIVLSARRRGVSWFAAAMEVAKRLVIIGVLGIKAGSLLSRYAYALRGVAHGLLNRGGSMVEASSSGVRAPWRGVTGQ